MLKGKKSFLKIYFMISKVFKIKYFLPNFINSKYIPRLAKEFKVDFGNFSNYVNNRKEFSLIFTGLYFNNRKNVPLILRKYGKIKKCNKRINKNH